MSLVYFILLIGPLIFFHELGHFIAARAFGVGVVRFSIGFGPRLFGFTRKGTEFVIGALPLGGYVRMVGMEPGEAAQLPERERKRALWAKPIWQRFIIVLAGPLANLILPLPIFIAVYAAQDGRPPARVGTVIDDMPADRAGLLPGDRIVSIDGESVRYFDQLQDLIGDAADREIEVTVERQGEELTVAMRPELIRDRDRWVGLRAIERPVIGIRLPIMGPLVYVSDPRGPAAQAGLMTFDRVVQVNGQPVRSYLALQQRIREARGQPLQLLVMRPRPLGEQIGALFLEDPVELTLVPGADAERTGMEPASTVVYSVQPGSPADEAGLRRGDKIISVGGRSYNVFSTLLNELIESPGTTFDVVYLRDGVEHATQLTPVRLDVTGELNQDVKQTFVGMRSLSTADYYPHAFDQFPALKMSFWERIAYGFRMGFQALFGFIAGIVVGVWQLIAGDVGLNNLGGPIMIFDIAGRAGSAGVEPFMRVMALISINLGILNLLPIPVLDGGNLMLFTIEAVKRSPITMRTRQIANYIGLAFILLLFLLVFKNDIERYWADIAESFD